MIIMPPTVGSRMMSAAPADAEGEGPSGKAHLIRELNVEATGLRRLSRAGSKRARLCISLQVVASKVDDPEEAVIVQPVTRPSVLMSRRKATVPCSPNRRAATG
jgi:hypothetical protein